MSKLTMQSTDVTYTDTIYCYRWESPPAFMKNDGGRGNFFNGLPASVPPSVSSLTLSKTTSSSHLASMPFAQSRQT
jgi:hypothetical protein